MTGFLSGLCIGFLLGLTTFSLLTISKQYDGDEDGRED